MKAAKTIDPTEYILSVLSQQERLEIAFKIANEAFKNTTLSMDDIQNAVKKIRRRHHESRKKKKSNN